MKSLTFSTRGIKESLNSYLIEITAEILRKKDEKTGAPLIDVILDKTGQKGTGKWTSLQAVDNGIPSSIITESLFARYLSSLKDERTAAEKVLAGPATEERRLDQNVWIDRVRQALYMGKICAYAQGFAQYKMTSDLNGWNLPLKDIALIFRGGCIIRAQFLNLISEAFDKQPDLSNLLVAPDFAEKLKEYQSGLRKVVCEGITRHLIPVPKHCPFLLRRLPHRPLKRKPPAGPARLFRRSHV